MRTKQNSAAYIQELWDEYHLTGSDSARNAIAEEYIPLVDMVAGRYADRVPPWVSKGDLSSWGMFGLMRAIEKFEPERNVRFATWASQKIRGSILDEMREASPMPRLLQRRISSVFIVQEKYRREQGREASQEEIYKAVTPKVARLVEQSEGLRTMHFTIDPETYEPVPAVDAIADRHEFDPSIKLHAEELMTMVINKFKLTEAIMLHYYFFEHFTMRQICELINVTESRVSQMMAATLQKLRAAA